MCPRSKSTTSLVLRPAQRIRKAADFRNCREHGRRVVGPHVILSFCKNDKELARIGLVVTKKTGSAVIRNRWKRIIRDFFRTRSEIFSPDTDYVWIVKSSIQGEPPQEIRQELEKLVRKIRR